MSEDSFQRHKRMSAEMDLAFVAITLGFIGWCLFVWLLVKFSWWLVLTELSVAGWYVSQSGAVQLLILVTLVLLHIGLNQLDRYIKRFPGNRKLFKSLFSFPTLRNYYQKEERMTFITEDMKMAVKSGSVWMDENYPGWAHRIDVAELEMANCDLCVIGQATMDLGYWHVIEGATGNEGMGAAIDWAQDNGFDADSRKVPPGEWLDEGGDLSQVAKDMYFGLETLWSEEVRNRLG